QIREQTVVLISSGESMHRFTPRLTRELSTFLILTFGLSTIFYILFARAGTLTAGGGSYVFMLMWCPGVSALATRLIFQRNVRGEGWKWGPTRYEIIGYVLPIVYAAAAYGESPRVYRRLGYLSAPAAVVAIWSS